ncbi:ATP-dependent DNA helicase RecG [Tistrella mobilis]|uniref:ATP-dependent DNA helicase RecG n=1 Tax=Tistrella mobilis TaxID=171437 RepID=UPI0035579E35
MRPEALFPLFAEATSLPGIGPRVLKLVERAARGSRVIDVINTLPVSVVDRRHAPPAVIAPAGRIATFTLTILEHQPAERPRQPHRVRCADPDGTGVTLVFFHGREADWRRLMPEGEVRIVSGKVERYGGEVQMPHPDHIVPPEKRAEVETVEAIYPGTDGLSPKLLRKAAKFAVSRLPELPEWIDRGVLAREGWSDWRSALATAHAPADADDLSPLHPARRRLAYDELFANQLAIALVRNRQRRAAGRHLAGTGRLTRPIEAGLPFRLTQDQRQVLSEIAGDMAGPMRMLRLLQGDVGSGKTVVALIAMAIAVEAGAQAALMAPTDVLARQHMETLVKLGAPAGLRFGLLTGRERAKARREVLAALEAGEIDILVGTHALFQDGVAFRDLGLAVIDEQHRFGVHQRLQLSSKGRGVDTLVMTATPIPRTLALTTYGDMDVSRIRQKPAGRKPIQTRVLPMDRMDQVIDAVRRTIDEGHKVYWVCPLVDVSEKADLSAASARAEDLVDQLGPRVGLIHGKMKGADKDAAIARFRATEADDRTDVLVATTVIEVGVDVPDATVIIIEHAERFGLAQLHQLRGRVGRGDDQASCLLLYAAPLGEIARKRLEVMRATEDGFVIAEEDLKLRGAGDALGTKQSGEPEMRFADLDLHADLIEIAQAQARLEIERTPELDGPRGQALRTLLYLFERDQAVRYLRSG